MTASAPGQGGSIATEGIAGPDRGRRRRGARGDLIPVVMAAAAVVGFYVALYPARNVHVPIGSDAPVYVWWARSAGALGLGPFGTGARPGVVGLVAAIGVLTRMPVAAVAEALGPALAAALALAAAALGTTCTRPRRPRVTFVLVAVLTGVFLAYLVPGYLSTLAFMAPFVAMLAVVALGSGRPGAGSFVGGGALLVSAGLSHPLFLLLAGGISAGAAAATVPAWIAGRRAGVAFAESAFGRLLLSWTLALPVVGLGLAASGAAAGAPAMNPEAGLAGANGSLPPSSAALDTSRDALLRRTHLGTLLRDSYRRKLHHDVPWWRSATSVALAMTALPLVSTRGPAERAAGAHVERERSALFWGAVGLWLLVTLFGVALLLFGRSAAPGQRLFVVCLPLPVLAGLGLAAVRHRRRWVAATAVAVGAGLFVVSLGSYWWASPTLISPTQLTEARAVGAALGAMTPGTALVLVADDRGDKPALFLTRYANVLRDAVPAARVADVYLWVGTPADFMRRAPTLTGRPEHDRMALDYRRRALPHVGRRSLAVEIQSFDRTNFRAAAALQGSRLLAPGVVVLPAHMGRNPAPGAPTAPSLRDAGAGPLSPWLPVAVAPLLLAALAAVGWPWARLALGAAAAPIGADAAVAAVAPAFGAAAIGIGSVATDAIGIRLSSAGGATVTAVAALLGWAVLAWSRRPGVRASANGPTPGTPGSEEADPARAGSD